MNIVDDIFRTANPSNTALIDGEVSLSFSELQAEVELFSGQLKPFATASAFGAKPRIGLLWQEGFRYVICALGILRAGACLVPIAPELSKKERLALAEKTALHAIVTEPSTVPDNPPPPPSPIVTNSLEAAFRSFLPTSPAPFSENAFAALNPAFIRFSSGTTGESKGVILSHQTLLDRISSANDGLAIEQSDRIFWILPMAHHFAVSIVLYLWRGATTVLCNSHLAEEMLASATASNASVIYGAPFHYRLLAATPNPPPWPSLRLAVSTACALPLETARSFSEKFGIPLTQGLGIIEAGLPILNTANAALKPGSIGRPLPKFSCKILPPSDSCTTTHSTGELCIKGPGIFDAYLSPWKTRAEVCEDGWFRTGDLAEKDTDGDLFLVGRSKSVINVGGLKCFPEEIEAVLDSHPSVLRSKVSARNHPQYGSIPTAEIVPADPASPPSKTELSKLCQQNLARYKIPVVFSFVDSIALTASGKIKRP